MRKIFFCILFFGIFINTAIYSQYKPDEIWVLIDSVQISQQTSNVYKTNIQTVDYTLQKYETQQFVQVFPYSKIDQLRNLYKIKFKGNQDNFISELQNIKGIKQIIKRPTENQIALYNPSDYIWQTEPSWLWHLSKIQADKAWDITKGNPNIKIASIDTWFDINHPDLVNKIYPKYDPYDNTPYNSDCSKNDHGTAVASFIAAETDGGGQLASVGFNCTLICYQAWAGDYIERAHHAAMVMHADVITSSAGGWDCSNNINQYEKLALKEILDNGTIVVMPAGNGPTGTSCNYNGRDHAFKPLSPEYDDRVIIVSSTDINDKHYYWNPSTHREETHSHFPEVDICAPGYNIMGAKSTQIASSGSCVSNPWPYYGSCTGTSFATPIVAGVVGLMKSVNTCLTPEQAQNILKASADPIVDASSYPGMVGAGRVNAYKAVLKTKEDVIITSKTIWNSQNSIGGDLFVNSTLILNANLSMMDGKKIVVNKGGNLILNNSQLANCRGMWDGLVDIKPNGTLTLNTGSEIHLKGNGKILVENGGKLIYNSGANIVLQDDNTLLEIQGNLHIGDNADFTFTGSGYVKFSMPTPVPFALTRNITAGTGARMTFKGADINDKVLEVTQEGMYPPDNISFFMVIDGTVALGKDSRVTPTGGSTAISFRNARITSTSGTNNAHRGLTIFGQRNVTIDGCVFENGTYGIYAFLTYGGGSPKISNTTFQNCKYGLWSHDKGFMINFGIRSLNPKGISII